MTDLPSQGLYQQLHARPVSGEHLEVLGKKASAEWQSGRADTLSSAVVETVKHAGLSPEQVRRVVEFANTDAFLSEFRKEGQANKIVDFGSGGPASPAEVIRDLNDGGGGSVFDDGLGDYRSSPKHASASDDDALFAALSGTSGSYEYADSYTDALDLRDKLAGALDHITAELNGCDGLVADAVESIYQNVKQAALSGHSLGQVLRAWEGVAPSLDHVKLAFATLSPRLIEEGVFTPHSLGSSLQKTASVGVVNQAHPLIQDFSLYCAAVTKVAHLEAGREEVALALGQIEEFVKAATATDAAATAVKEVAKAPTLRRFLSSTEHLESPVAEGVGKFLKNHVSDSKHTDTVAKGVGKVVKKLPHIGAGVVGYNAYQQAQQAAAHPAAQKALSYVPGTDANRNDHERAMYEAMTGQRVG